jgi:hypothetical protein
MELSTIATSAPCKSKLEEQDEFVSMFLDIDAKANHAAFLDAPMQEAYKKQKRIQYFGTSQQNPHKFVFSMLQSLDSSKETLPATSGTSDSVDHLLQDILSTSISSSREYQLLKKRKLLVAEDLCDTLLEEDHTVRVPAFDKSLSNLDNLFLLEPHQPTSTITTSPHQLQLEVDALFASPHSPFDSSAFSSISSNGTNSRTALSPQQVWSRLTLALERDSFRKTCSDYDSLNRAQGSPRFTLLVQPHEVQRKSYAYENR